MCDICMDVKSKAQKRARDRILLAEITKITKKIHNLTKILTRKFFPFSIGNEVMAYSRHTKKWYYTKSWIYSSPLVQIRNIAKDRINVDHLNLDFHFVDTEKINEIKEKPIKDRNTFYAFPYFNGRFFWVPKYFYFHSQNTIKEYKIFNKSGLLYDPPKEVLQFLYANGTEVKFL